MKKQRWNPDDFEGISSTRLPYDKVKNYKGIWILQFSKIRTNVQVWRPDIVLYNFAGQEYGSNEMSTFIQVGIKALLQSGSD